MLVVRDLSYCDAVDGLVSGTMYWSRFLPMSVGLVDLSGEVATERAHHGILAG